MTCRSILLAAAVACISTQALAAPAITALDKAALFAAAGFKAKGNTYVRCADDTSSSYMAGAVQPADLNGDGLPEAFVTESSTFCYGSTEQAFVLLTRGKDGKWSKLLEQVGVADVKSTKTMGWPDIEVGGPGMGPFPVYRFNGKTYVTR